MRVYFDACCLNRPFDDQSQDRIRLESEAVKIIMDLCSKGIHSWVISNALEFEITQNPNAEKRAAVLALLGTASECIQLGESANLLARQLLDRGIRPMDALHLSLADVGGCDILLTVDDDLLRRSRDCRELTIRVENPARFVVDELEGL